MVCIMKYNKSLKTFVVFIVVAVLLISSFVSIGVSSKTSKIDIKTRIGSGSKVRIKNPEPHLDIKSSIISSNIFNDFNTSENIVISDDPVNESYPSMITSGLTGLALYHNEDDMRIYLRNSRDFGKTWSQGEKIEVYYSSTEPDIDVFSPDISLSPGNNIAYGAYISPKNNQAVHGYFKTENIGGNPPSTSTFTLDWSQFTFYNFTNSEIVTYQNSTTPWVITFIGSTKYEA